MGEPEKEKLQKVVDIYSKRKKQERGEVPDVYQYQLIPKELRTQVVHIWRSVFGPVRIRHGYDGTTLTSAGERFDEVRDMLCREWGVFELTTTSDDSGYDEIKGYLFSSDHVDRLLDIIELTFLVIDRVVRVDRRFYGGRGAQSPDDAIAELNYRFREHGVGYQYESGQIIRIDSKFMHAEVVKPVLQLLFEKEFAGANQEFLSAHEHYRHQKFKECLADCLKAFESAMKSICTKRNWAFASTDTAKSLLDIMFKKGVIPEFMQSHFGGLRSTLEAGVPTVRNKLGGHGQGVTEVKVPDFIASYALHLTATSILLLVNAERALTS